MSATRIGRARSKPARAFDRGGRSNRANPGTVGLAGQRVPIRVPRIRGVAGSEIPLRSYAALHGYRAVNNLLLRRVLYGISCRNYEAAAEAIPGAIGLTGSTVSRGFIQASAAQLRELQERDLSREDVVAAVVQDDELSGVCQCAGRGTVREGRSLADLKPTPPLAGDGAPGHRTPSAEGDGLPAPVQAA